MFGSAPSRSGDPVVERRGHVDAVRDEQPDLVRQAVRDRPRELAADHGGRLVIGVSQAGEAEERVGRAAVGRHPVREPAVARRHLVSHYWWYEPRNSPSRPIASVSVSTGARNTTRM